VVPVTWKAQIRRIMVTDQSRGKKLARPISTNKLGMVTCTCHPSYARSINGRITIQVDLGKNAKPYLKNNYNKRAGGVAQVIEHLPTKYKDMRKTLGLQRQSKKIKKHYKCW
jgi:hypothetical protein